jgi:hypothetical protein
MAFRLLYLSSFSKETIVTKINLKRRLWVASVAVVALFLLNACYTDYGLSIEEYDVVATQYDVDYNFTDKGRNTYVLDDTVRHLVREGEEPDRKYDAQLLAKVEAEMAAKGFTKVDYDEDNPAPFAVTISTANRDVFNYYWGGYPCWGWWGCGGWYYPPYWGGYVGYSYSSGSVIVTMVDLPGSINDPEDNALAIWSGALNGVTNDSQANIANRIDSGIEQAFTQSPYLDRN